MKQIIIGASALAVLAGGQAVAEDAVRVLPETVVSASRTPLDRAAAGSAVTVITAEEIERKQAKFASDLLREVPGVALSRTGPVGAQTQVRIRGAEANHTLVLIDGVEVNDPSGASEFDFSTMLAADIARIEVLRGPQSALYGSDAIGGVINIVTRRGQGPMRAQAAVEGGSFETGAAYANMRGAQEAFDYSLGVSVYHTEGVSFAREKAGFTEEDGFDSRTVHGKIGFQPVDILDVEIVGRFVDSNLEFDETGNVNGFSVPVDTDSETEAEQLSAGVRAALETLDGQWEHIVGGTALHVDRINRGGFPSTFIGERWRVYYQSNVFLETPEFADASHVFTFLAEHETDGQDVDSAFTDSDVESETHSFVGEYRLSAFDRLFLSGSVRFDDNDLFKNATTVRATAAYAHRETDTRLHASYGEGVKNPTLFELFGFAPGFTPNPNLRPESSEGWDIGVEQTLLGGRAVLDVTFFRSQIEDLIQGAGNTAINLAGTNKIDGLEFSLALRPVEALTLKAQYTYMETEDANGAKLIRRPDHLASVNAAYRFFGDRATIDVGADYHGHQKDFAFQAVAPFGRQTVTLDDYVLVNIAGSYRLTESFELYGRIENLLDEDCQNVFGTDNPGVGAFIGLRATFGG